MGKVTQNTRTVTKTTQSSRTTKSSKDAQPKTSQHPVNCCVHKTHSKKP